MKMNRQFFFFINKSNDLLHTYHYSISEDPGVKILLLVFCFLKFALEATGCGSPAGRPLPGSLQPQKKGHKINEAYNALNVPYLPCPNDPYGIPST